MAPVPRFFGKQGNKSTRLGARKGAILLAVEIVTIYTNPKRKRGNDLATSLALRLSVRHNREQYSQWNTSEWAIQGNGIDCVGGKRLYPSPVIAPLDLPPGGGQNERVLLFQDPRNPVWSYHETRNAIDRCGGELCGFDQCGGRLWPGLASVARAQSRRQGNGVYGPSNLAEGPDPEMEDHGRPG